MTLQVLGHTLHYPGFTTGVSAGTNVGSLATLDVAGEYQAYVFQAKENMTISHVGWRCGTATGSPTADTRIESVAADGTPSGTLWAANTNLVSGALAANTNTLHALTASASISKGQMFCVKILYNSGTSFVVQSITGLSRVGSSIPYLVTNTTGSAVKARMGVLFFLALGSSSTSFYVLGNCLYINAINSDSFNNTSSAARGVRFQVPFKCTCVGVAWATDGATGDFKPILTDDAGTSLIGTNSTIDGDHNTGLATGSINIFFDTSADLSPNVWYRAGIEPQSATNLTLRRLSLPSTSYVSSFWGKGFWQRAERVSGTWTDTDTDLPTMDIIISALDDGRSSRARSLIGIA